VNEESPEEIFGSAYLDCKRRVRRWLSLIRAGGANEPRE
jgi:hypothetical protein